VDVDVDGIVAVRKADPLLMEKASVIRVDRKIIFVRCVINNNNNEVMRSFWKRNGSAKNNL